MGVYLSCTVLYPDAEGNYKVEDDYDSNEGPLCGNKSSDRAALLCSRYTDRLNFKAPTGPHPATLNKAGQSARWHDEPGATCTTIWGRNNVNWYYVTELHELMNTVPRAMEILGKDCVEEIYRILQEQPKAIIQFACDQ